MKLYALILLILGLTACEPPPAEAEAVPTETRAQHPAPTEAHADGVSADRPPLGRYVCNHVWWNVAQRRSVFDYKGYVELLTEDTYRWLDDGGTGRYAFNGPAGTIAWASGPLAEKQPGRTTYGLDGDTPEITFFFEDPVTWQCARES